MSSLYIFLEERGKGRGKALTEALTDGGDEQTLVDTEIKPSKSASFPEQQNIIYGPHDSLFSGQGKENMKWTEEKYSVRFRFVSRCGTASSFTRGDLYWKRGHVTGAPGPEATRGTARDGGRGRREAAREC